MMQAMLKHRDCRNFAPLDVVKGICHRTKDMIPADGDSCQECVPVPKCRGCLNFLPGRSPNDPGLCDVSPQRPKFFAYPDMVAVTCDHFRPLEGLHGAP